MEDEATVPLPAEDRHPLLFGERWRVVALLGTGGMGSVYLAHDAELGELVALKMVRPQLAVSAEMLERFREEVRLSRRVSSPYVARTHDLGEYEGRLFLSMQYVEGETLSARLKREGALPLGELVRIAHDVCAGLDAVHAAGVVHRDLKPANVLLANDGRAVITDFGIALRASARGRSDGSGTPTWAAPEQLFGDAVDARTDVYALGAVLFAAATGQRPFHGARTGVEAPPDPRAIAPSLPDAFRSVVMRALAPEPRVRFSSAGAVYDALEPLAAAAGRAESRLFSFVRSICGAARILHVFELARDGVSADLEHAVRGHLVSRLVESGDVRTSDDEGEAEAVVAGSIAAHAGACTLRLEVRSREGDVFYCESFEGPTAALPSLAERAASALARALATRARPVDDGARFDTEEAAHLFLEARAEYRRFLPANVDRSVALLERVVELSPRNATALAWKGAALARQRFYHQGPDRTRPLVERALALGLREPVSYMALAQSCMQDMLVGEAVGHFLTAVRLAPGMGDVRGGFAFLLLELGAFEPAQRLAESILRDDPSDVGLLEIPLRIAALRGRFDRLGAILADVDWTLPGSQRLQALRYAMWEGNLDAARRAAERADRRSLDAASRELHSALVSGVLEGRLPEKELHQTLTAFAGRRRAVALQIGSELCAYLRQDALFYDTLDRAVAAGVFDSPWIDCCPLFDRYRGSLHFEAARRTIQRRSYDALAEMERCLGEPS